MTGAGKTHTMQGTREDPGVIYRSIERVMKLIEGERNANPEQDADSWKVFISYFELYNEKVYDLSCNNNIDLPIREDYNRKIIIQNLNETQINSYEDFCIFYDDKAKNRSTASTRLNSHSSRSHAVLMVRVLAKDLDNRSPTYGNLLEGKLHLIDLAGSEDNRKTDNVGKRIVESSNINSSLFVLAKVVQALNDGDKRIPYRDSKLTRLLQDSLGGQAIGIMIANVAPGQTHFLNTFNTLNFASKSRKVVNIPTVNSLQEKSKDEPFTMRDKLESWKKKKRGDKGAAREESCEDLLLVLDKPLKDPSLKRSSTEENIRSSKKLVPQTPCTRTKLFVQRILDAQRLEVKSSQMAFDTYLSIIDDMRPYENVYRHVIDKIGDRCTKLMCAIMDEDDLKYNILQDNFDTCSSSQHNSKTGNRKMDKGSFSSEKSSLFDEENIENTPRSKSRNDIPLSITRRQKSCDISDEDEDINDAPRKKLSFSPSLEAKIKQAIEKELELLEFSVEEQINDILDILNRGTEKDIKTLHGIGNIKAVQIVEYRDNERANNGSFAFDGIENLARFGLRERAITTFIKRNIIEAVYFKNGLKSNLGMVSTELDSTQKVHV